MDAALAFEQGVFLVKFQKFTFSMSVLQQKSSTSIATIWRQLRWRTAGRGLPGRGMAGRMQPPPHLRMQQVPPAPISMHIQLQQQQLAMQQQLAQAQAQAQAYQAQAARAQQVRGSFARS